MPKDAQSLEESRDIRSFLLQRYGLEPRSIMREDWRTKTHKKYTTYAQQKVANDPKGSPFSLSGVGARHGSLSDFPHTIARFILKFFCYDGFAPHKLEEPGYFGNYIPTVIDPFCGHNSRMEDVYSCGLNYLGHDICAEFMKANREIRDELLTKNAASMLPTNAQIQIHEGDSRAIINYNQVADFLIASPPFWNIEDYGPESGQLGHSKLYTDFITDLTTVFKNCYQALKPGSFAAVEVNDFREDGVFYCYHADTIAALKSVGFLMHDVIIIDYGSAFLSAFLSDVEHSKIMPKLHSYLLIAKRKSELRGLLRAETREKLKEMVAERNATTGFVGQAKML